MTNTASSAFSDPADELAYLAHLTVLVDKYRSSREQMSEETGRPVSFAAVAEAVVGKDRAGWLQEFLKELGEILDKNSPEAVDEDLELRLIDAASRLDQPQPAAGLPKLLP